MDLAFLQAGQIAYSELPVGLLNPVFHLTNVFELEKDTLWNYPQKFFHCRVKISLPLTRLKCSPFHQKREKTYHRLFLFEYYLYEVNSATLRSRLIFFLLRVLYNNQNWKKEAVR
mgnify:CR=1 FL=1